MPHHNLAQAPFACPLSQLYCTNPNRRCRFAQQQSQPGIFGASQQPQQQNQQQLSVFGTSQPPQQLHAGSFGTVLGQQQQAFNTTQLAAGVAPASQEIVAISRAFDKSSNDYRFRHLFLNVVDIPGSYGCPPGKTYYRTCRLLSLVLVPGLHIHLMSVSAKPHLPCVPQDATDQTQLVAVCNAQAA